MALGHGYDGSMATVRREPVEIHAHALDSLRYIRQTIERAGSFTAVPGIGGIVMGSTALAAAWLASHQTERGRWLAVWLGEAVLAMLVGIVGAEMKSRRARLALFSGPGRKFIAGFTPALAAGAVLTAVLFRTGALVCLPGMWLLLYGAGVLSGGGASVRVVPLMGACFMVAGAAALLSPGGSVAAGDVLLGAAFGGLHILFGTIIAVKYGG
jgi:hypothetical protein